MRVDAVRRLLADARLVDLPSHLTLIPPISLDSARAEVIGPIVRAAAVSVPPFSLGLGPVDSFAPRTPTLHLRVGGDLVELSRLRDLLRVDPLDRPDQHSFHPHVTLVQRCEPALTAAALQLLAGDLGEWFVDSVVVLERLRSGDRGVWRPILEEPLGGAVVVGRGGVELHLRSVRILDRSAAALLGRTGPSGAATRRSQLVTTAEIPGAVSEPAVLVGAAVGRAGSDGAVLERLVVDAEHRSKGVARQVLSAWIHSAGLRGADVVTTWSDDAAQSGLLEALGFIELGSSTWCRRVGLSR